MKGLFKFIIGLIITIVVIAILLLIGFFVLINFTPRKLKFADKKIINNKSCVDLGIADTKFKSLIDDFKTITKKKESEIVKNPWTNDSVNESKNMLDKVGLVKDGNIDFEELFNTGLDSSSQFYFTYNDTSMAYVLNESISYISDGNSTLSSLKLKIDEVSFLGDDKEMRIVFEASISEFKDGIEKYMPGFLAKWIGIPEKIYVVSYFNVDVTSEGRLDLTHKDLLINDCDTALSSALLNALSTETNTIENFNESFGDSIEEAVSYLGKIGTASSDSNGVVTGNISYGAAGYGNGKITLIGGVI